MVQSVSWSLDLYLLLLDKRVKWRRGTVDVPFLPINAPAEWFSLVCIICNMVTSGKFASWPQLMGLVGPGSAALVLME